MPTRSISPPPGAAASSSASISSSFSSLSFCPSRSKNLTPLYSGGLCDAVITAPTSSASSATAGVGSTPARTAEPPADAMPRPSASSSSTPDARVSRPTNTRPRPDQSETALPSLSTSSGVRLSPTIPRTPSVPKYLRAIGARSLRDRVQALPPRCHQPKRDAQLRIELDERTRDTVADGSRLTARAAAVHAHADVVAALELCGPQRSERGLPVDGPREVLLNRPSVEPRRPVTRPQDHAGNRRLSLAGSLVLRDLRLWWHQSSHGSGLGACASCGCSGPA